MLIDHRDPFIQTIDEAKTIQSTRDLADKVIDISDSALRQTRLLAGNHLNPFFVPRQNPQGNALNAVQALYLISQLRMAAANGAGERLVVSAPMKTGSTYLSQVLYLAFGANPVNLSLLTMRPFDHALYGAGARSHEIDELALLYNCMEKKGFVAHHHMLCTPMLTKQIELYNLKFILLKRNIFDCIVSLDDYMRKFLTVLGDSAEVYRRKQLPTGWVNLATEERIHHLLDGFLTFYVDYYVSWSFHEMPAQVSPLWLSYEEDLLGEKEAITSKICSWAGRGDADADKLLKEFKRERDGGQFHFNKGVAGRGKAIQGKNRERVIAAFDAFKGLVDWTELLD